MFSHLNPSQVVGPVGVGNVQLRHMRGKEHMGTRGSLNVASVEKTEMTEQESQPNAQEKGSCASYHCD